ncbi:MAG: zinc-binding dehydrogenase [Thermomicrobiales bacterium]
MPRTSRTAIFHGAGQPLELRTFDVPDLLSGSILVRVRACTICGSDLHSFHGRRHVKTPTILGHEISGTIEEFGPDAPQTDISGQALRIGDRVTWSLCVSCGRCRYCTQELPQKCERLAKFGHEELHPGWMLTGGLAEYCVLPVGTSVLRLPETIPDEVACPLSCATATVASALRAGGGAESIVILGAGTLGVTACAMARQGGARIVIASDRLEERMKVAQEFGATHTCSSTMEDLRQFVSSTTQGGADVVLEMSGTTPAIELALGLVRTGGTIVLVGSVLPTPSVSIDPEMIVRRILTIRGVHNYAPCDLIEAVRFMERAQKDYPFADLVQARFPLDQVNEAFHFASEHPGVRVMVVP